ncbi:hypothetical protein KEM52_004320, partial [Ascosphaera acerosa]
SIGRHCEFEFCRQLDFLPFRCESCRATFCLDHRTETAHQCPRAGEWARRRAQASESSASTPATTTITSTSTSTPTTTSASASPSPAPSSAAASHPTVLNSEQCAHLSCKTLIHALQPGVHCSSCNRDYCLKHRLKEDHDCAAAAAATAARTTAAPSLSSIHSDRAKSAFARLRAWGKEKTAAMSPGRPADSSGSGSGSKSKPAAGRAPTAAQRVAALNALKRSAVGDARIAPQNRLYVHVEAAAETVAARLPKGAFFFDSAWSVGKVLDDAARRLQVQNTNNREGEESRLRVFHVQGGRLLEFSDKLGATHVAQGDTLVLLRGLSLDAPDMIQP